jgi:hypothetical protein
MEEIVLTSVEPRASELRPGNFGLKQITFFGGEVSRVNLSLWA